jgi:hypothetical protein
MNRAMKRLHVAIVIGILSAVFLAHLLSEDLQKNFDVFSLNKVAAGGVNNIPVETSLVTSPNLVKTEMMEHGVVAQASSWNQPLPCLEPDEAMKGKFGFRAPAMSGFLFLKLVKVGGSTATGVTMRIAKHVAERRNETFWICRGHWDHSYAFKMLEHRDRSQSFTWTLL